MSAAERSDYFDSLKTFDLSFGTPLKRPIPHIPCPSAQPQPRPVPDLQPKNPIPTLSHPKPKPPIQLIIAYASPPASLRPKRQAFFQPHPEPRPSYPRGNISPCPAPDPTSYPGDISKSGPPTQDFVWEGEMCQWTSYPRDIPRSGPPTQETFPPSPILNASYPRGQNSHLVAQHTQASY